MSHVQTMFYVVIPQVMRNILPSVSNEFVINIKDTSVLNVIGVAELYYYAGIIKKMNFQIFQTYVVICVLYFVLTFTVTKLLRMCERKLDGKDNYTICGSQSNSFQPPFCAIQLHNRCAKSIASTSRRSTAPCKALSCKSWNGCILQRKTTPTFRRSKTACCNSACTLYGARGHSF